MMAAQKNIGEAITHTQRAEKHTYILFNIPYLTLTISNNSNIVIPIMHLATIRDTAASFRNDS